ncbi:TPA: hypothetical protein ROX87_003978 [Bacillus thuringiensis]|uniref:hypothetical protein n=1 Tax=Bacillus TaxID=1386 RepID=UPI000BF90C76|nr:MULTISPECIES: hypothetical protein [Bacillus]PER47425.1 hypothetical protein CN472_10035 [Bacillus thuringiensis]PYE95028.1 hypothetical protein ATL10_100461 [Bacillus sp. 196mf]HDX9534537.1 hypothetical protein [Bacillus thuringiensis]
MNSLTIQGNTYDLNEIKRIIEHPVDMTIIFDADMYKRFQKDIYTTYKQIRHICNPRACEKTSLQTVKASLKEHWLEQYLNLSLEEANLIIEYADKFFGLAIK